MLKIRRPLGRLIFNMGIAIPGKTVFLIETAPSSASKRVTPVPYSQLLRRRWDLFLTFMHPGSELLNRGALKLSTLNKNHIFQCPTFCVDFQSIPFKFHTRYLTHTLKDMICVKSHRHWPDSISSVNMCCGYKITEAIPSKNFCRRVICKSPFWYIRVVHGLWDSFKPRNNRIGSICL